MLICWGFSYTATDICTTKNPTSYSQLGEVGLQMQNRKEEKAVSEQ